MKYSRNMFYDIGTDGSACIGGLGKCRGTNIVIPPVYQGTNVTSIRYAAFWGCASLKSVTIPNSVTRVGWNAFYECTGLTSVTIGNGIMSIEDGAFFGCTNLKSSENNYKAFSIVSGKLKCRNKTYTVGEKSACSGRLILCENGIHYCTNIFDIFNYYYGEYGLDFVIGICDVSDENVGGRGDSKRCARWVIPKKILTREEVINIMNRGDISE